MKPFFGLTVVIALLSGCLGPGPRYMGPIVNVEPHILRVGDQFTVSLLGPHEGPLVLKEGDHFEVYLGSRDDLRSQPSEQPVSDIKLGDITIRGGRGELTLDLQPQYGPGSRGSVIQPESEGGLRLLVTMKKEGRVFTLIREVPLLIEQGSPAPPQE